MDSGEVRSGLLRVLNRILTDDPRGLSIGIAGSVDPALFGEEPYPTITFFGYESYQLHRVDPDGGFIVTMNFGPQNGSRTLNVPAAKIAAWAYLGARVALPGNEPPPPSEAARRAERPPLLRIVRDEDESRESDGEGEGPLS